MAERRPISWRRVVINIRKILYPTDFSSYSNQAYFHAVALAENHGASLTILYVYSPTSAIPDIRGRREADRQYWREQLEQIRPVDTAISVRHVLRDGDAASEIIRFAAEEGSDLIVMGTHGRTGIERLLLGSVAEKVMREAPCSVLVVKLPKGIPATERPNAGLALSPA